MKQRYSLTNFTPSETTLAIIRQFAYTYRTMQIGPQRMAMYLN